MLVGLQGWWGREEWLGQDMYNILYHHKSQERSFEKGCDHALYCHEGCKEFLDVFIRSKGVGCMLLLCSDLWTIALSMLERS